MPQPDLNLGSLAAASKDDAGKRGEESKFDHAMALQEEPIQVSDTMVWLLNGLNELITFLLPDDSTVSNEVCTLAIMF
ncbi:hypothetical protein PHMEG_00026578 [Phytophthora megakarya]|uniref:Uncharacterized protein n=1 Tax=Phytophthora megakarya TaxID=4795 RepID=A0A225V8Y8_9STRA|nr:hypothetical protein PHMEG_00026578 [Phytophthora megakarya]